LACNSRCSIAKTAPRNGGSVALPRYSSSAQWARLADVGGPGVLLNQKIMWRASVVRAGREARLPYLLTVSYLTPVQPSFLTGAFQRRSATGGFAYGILRKRRLPPTISPCTLPSRSASEWRRSGHHDYRDPIQSQHPLVIE
jgi:hypothetical protein